MELYSILLFIICWLTLGVIAAGWMGTYWLFAFGDTLPVFGGDVFMHYFCIWCGPLSLISVSILTGLNTTNFRPPEKLFFIYRKFSDDEIGDNFIIQSARTYVDIFGSMDTGELYEMFKQEYPRCHIDRKDFNGIIHRFGV